MSQLRDCWVDSDEQSEVRQALKMHLERNQDDPTNGTHPGYESVNGPWQITSTSSKDGGPRFPEGYQPIRTSGTLVRTEELAIVMVVLLLWVAAIALFINRWGKIRLMEPYNPYFEPVSTLDVNNSINNDEDVSLMHHPRASLTVISSEFGHRRHSNLSNFHFQFQGSSDRKLSVYQGGGTRGSSHYPIRRPSFLVPDYVPSQQPSPGPNSLGLADLAGGLMVPSLSRSRRTSMCSTAEYLLKKPLESRRSSSLCGANAMQYPSGNSLHVPGSIPRFQFSQPSPTSPGSRSILSMVSRLQKSPSSSFSIEEDNANIDLEEGQNNVQSSQTSPFVKVLLENELSPEKVRRETKTTQERVSDCPVNTSDYGKSRPYCFQQEFMGPSTAFKASDNHRPEVRFPTKTSESCWTGSTCSSKQSDV
ncbi:hypothetical protein TCAL_08261 [Tigriopus californicus]|uniref:Fibronectin type III domain-containing protein n=1 Tax=Tigriopus californicus TaxID=6832 RepID=A0A553NZR4_TIGCA|nr:uncharacterized protein LOC131886639 [Tigriopus californicus]XP_059091014.1 uncharacterized protein LOC131886639 [Tigriopus californicus]TRY70934.1 hypothetical protein TCAL_08261 [Tigriopus californicus]